MSCRSNYSSGLRLLPSSGVCSAPECPGLVQQLEMEILWVMPWLSSSQKWRFHGFVTVNHQLLDPGSPNIIPPMFKSLSTSVFSFGIFSSWQSQRLVSCPRIHSSKLKCFHNSLCYCELPLPSSSMLPRALACSPCLQHQGALKVDRALDHHFLWGRCLL